MNALTPFSEASMIAIHAMALIASAIQPLQAHDIAAKMRFSRHHTASVLRRLATRALIISTRGPKGGYLLTSDGREASLLDIIEIFDGQMLDYPCRSACDHCHFEPCIFGPQGMGWHGLKIFLKNQRINQLHFKTIPQD